MHQPVEVVRPRLRHVSTEDQTPLPQSQALKSAGCVEIHEEQASGGNRARPVLARVLERISRAIRWSSCASTVWRGRSRICWR